ncbi:MAG: ABC transporter ATP-binding protein [Candidatus Bipolaricaulota bacterium]|nr:ABC transporter ATP-binding protein [Candidatus Bipolaricaulota bacterium]MDW8126470.1 ABC transporter ATP-binding protein [Candidatus Bipolaricaulota bacterium]
MLELERVTKIYRLGVLGRKALKAVDSVSFTVARGQVISLIGESGSGKTTIGRMILRLTPVTFGRILFQGADISKFHGLALKNYYRRVQGVFQDPFSSYNPIFKADRIFNIVQREFFPHLTKGEWRERVANALCSVGLEPGEVLGKYPHQLSGGQLQRLLIARAMLLEIQFLVADEILSMLDASTRIDVLNLLAELKRIRDLAVLFITHDLSLAYYISDEAIIIYRGYIVEQGAIEKVFVSPLHPYTRMLLAAVPRLDRKWGPAEVGLKAQEGKIVGGCPYHDRCLHAEKEETCKHLKPSLVFVDDRHSVACHPMGRLAKGVSHGTSEARGTSVA